jgi:hypothetical protein
MTYFAVQTRSVENDLEVTGVVVRAAHALGMKFTKIEAFDRFTLGGTIFLRFRAEGDMTPLLDKIYTEGRPVIGPVAGTGEFIARLKGRSGAAPTATMLSVPHKTLVFRGPGAQYWERQFEAPN